jgi:transcriptional regulator GlxA family with amidase domain
MIGYSQQLVKANKKADQKMLGVQLGKMCIAGDIPVKELAQRLCVSRTAVYAWFKGESEISPVNYALALVVVKKLAA